MITDKAEFPLGQGSSRIQSQPQLPFSAPSPPLPTLQLRAKCFGSSQTHLRSSHPEGQLFNVAFSRALVWNGSNHKHEVVPAATKGRH